jgi:hypothetical protein
VNEWNYAGHFQFVGWIVLVAVVLGILTGVIKTRTEKERGKTSLKGLVVSELFAHEASVRVRGVINRGLTVEELDVRLSVLGSPHKRKDIEAALKELHDEGKVTDTYVAGEGSSIGRHSWALKW